MKKNYLFLAFMLLSTMGFAQCFGGFQYPTSAVVSNNDGNVQTVATCNYAGDFFNVTGLNIGDDYEFTSDVATDYLTLTDDANVVIASGVTPLIIPAIANANVRLHIFADAACTTEDDCRVTTIQCTTCTPPPAPDCASNPMPADGAVDVPYGDVTFTWSAPTTGPTPTSYNLYAGETPSGDDYGLLGNYTTESADLTISAYNAQLYWIVKPVNGSTEASGCPVWNFTTEMAPAPPVNDNLCDAIPLTVDAVSSGGAYTNVSATIQPSELGGTCWFLSDPASESVWFSFVAPASGEVQISTVYDEGSLADTQLALYSVGDCNDFNTVTELACDEDDDADIDSEAGLHSIIQYTSLTAGTTYYIQVDGYSDNTGTFDISVQDLANLSVNGAEALQSFTYSPNPVIGMLNLKAQSNIQNVSIYNMLGQEVIKTSPNRLHSEVDMSVLQSGAYFVKVTINDATETIRVVKQ